MEREFEKAVREWIENDIFYIETSVNFNEEPDAYDDLRIEQQMLEGHHCAEIAKLLIKQGWTLEDLEDNPDDSIHETFWQYVNDNHIKPIEWY